jgi:hypothetical protein
MILDRITKSNFIPKGPKYRVYDYWYNLLVDAFNDMSDNGVITSSDNGMPIASVPSATITFFEDFIDTASTKAAGNGKFAIAADATGWFVTEVDSATGQTETVLGKPADAGTGASAQGGWGQFTTCNADNDCLSAQLNGESFKLAAGKKLWFETKFIINDVSEVEVFIGLADTGTDLYGAAGVGVNNHVGFMLDGDGNLDFSIDEAATQSKTDTTVDFVDGSVATLTTANVTHKCAFYWDGVNTVYVYVDDSLVLTKIDDASTIVIPDGTCLSPGFTILTQTTASATIYIDYIYVCQER